MNEKHIQHLKKRAPPPNHWAKNREIRRNGDWNPRQQPGKRKIDEMRMVKGGKKGGGANVGRKLPLRAEKDSPTKKN